MSDKNSGELDSLAEFKQRVLDDTKTIVRFQDEQGPSDSRSALKRLFAKIADDLSINDRKWRRLMEQYLRDPTNGIPNTSDEHVQARSSINKNFFSNDNMTWVMICRALRFIRVKRFRVGFTLVHSNNTTTEHGIWLNIRNDYPPLEGEDDPERTFNRVPIVQVRSDSADDPHVATPTGSAVGSIQAPTPLDIAGWRRNYNPPGSSESGNA